MTMPEPHLDDDAMNAFLDTAPAAPEVDVDAPARAHLGTCPSCSARLDALRAAAALVATPVAPLASSRIDELVGRAVGVSPPDVVDIASARSRRRLAVPTKALGAVAAVAALLLGVPAFLSMSSNRDEGSQAMVRESETAQGGVTAGDTAGDSEAAFDANTAARSAAGAGGGKATTESDAALAAPAAGGVMGATGERALGPIDTDDDLVRRLVAELSSGEQRGNDAASLCENEARAVGGDRISTRTFAASLTWRGEPARVFVFQLTEPAEGVSRQAYVLRSNGCAVLAEPRF